MGPAVGVRVGRLADGAALLAAAKADADSEVAGGGGCPTGQAVVTVEHLPDMMVAVTVTLACVPRESCPGHGGISG